MGNYANNYLMYYSMDPTMNMRIYTEKSKHQPEKWPLIPLARKQSQNSFPVSLLVNDNHHNNNHHNNNNNNNLKKIFLIIIRRIITIWDLVLLCLHCEI